MLPRNRSASHLNTILTKNDKLVGNHLQDVEMAELAEMRNFKQERPVRELNTIGDVF